MRPSSANATPNLSMTQRCRQKHREGQAWSNVVLTASWVETTVHGAVARTGGVTRDCGLLGLQA